MEIAVFAGFSADCHGRKAIVTGGTRGLGRVIAARLAEAGARVAVCGRNEPEVLPEGVVFHGVDIRDAAQAEQFVGHVSKQFGGLDILVNNAGGSPEGQFSDVSPRFLEAIVRLNLMAPMYLSQAALPHLVASGGGSIVNIASVSGMRPSPGTAAYGAAKAGLLNLTQTLAQEWGPHGIRVNAIVAGLMETENSAETYGDQSAQARIAASVPLLRMGTGDDIANAVLWLSSEASSWVSGARINIDGGGERPLFLELVKGS